MVIIYLLGLLDLAAAVSLALIRYFPFLRMPLIILSGLILLKSVMYIKNFASIMDLLAVALIVIAIMGYYPLIVYAAVIWLVQKGLRSFM